MSEMSDYLEDTLIGHLFRSATFGKPSVVAIALCTTTPVDGDGGDFTAGTGVEVPDANGYSRQTLNPLDGNWTATAGGDGQTDNATAITYTQATGSWGTVQSCAIVDNATFNSGNMWFYSTVDSSKAIDSGDTAEFTTGAITVTLA
jgi:hypothetical protein